MKNKIFAYFCAFALVLSVLVVPSFAYDTGDNYYFVDNPVCYNSFNAGLEFYCNDEYYNRISAEFEDGSSGQYYFILYWRNNESIVVYEGSSSGTSGDWVDDVYRDILILSNSSNQDLVTFLDSNMLSPYPTNGWYYDIYDTLHYAIFDGNDLTGAQDMVITLLSVVLCCIAVTLPIIVVLFFVKYILSMRFY